jgi:hypothetical protein
MSEPTQDAAPETGDRRVDEALRGVADLHDAPVDEHAERLSAAHSALQEVLRSPVEPAADPKAPAPRP